MNKKFFAKKRFKVLAAVILLVLAGGLISAKLMKPANQDEYVTGQVEKTDLLQTVSEVGVVKANEDVKLGFMSAGRLVSKLVRVGDQVKAGQILAELDNKSLVIQRQQAESSLSSARASLGKLIAGATASELAVMEAQVREAQKASESAMTNLDKTKKSVDEDIRQAEKTLSDLQSPDASNQTTYEQAVLSAKTALDNAKAAYGKSINNAIDTTITDVGAKLTVANTALDNVYTIIDNDDLKDYLSAKNKTYLENTKTAYLEAKALAVVANTSLYEALQDKSEAKVKKAAIDALAYLNRTADCLNECYSALEASTISATPLSAYKTTISTQLSGVNGAISVIQADKQALDGAYISYNTNVSAAENSLRSAEVSLDNAIKTAKNSLASIRLSGDQRIASAESGAKTSQEGYAVAKTQLAKMKSSARTEDIALAEAQVAQAQSALDLANKQIDDSLLKAPIDGRIVKDNFEVGEQVSPGQTVFSLLGENNYEIEVDISESDIAKIKEGNAAEVTLDAFGDDMKFAASVFFIDPAETVIQDVVYYKVTLMFGDDSQLLSGVKPGMTANVVIITDKREQVLVVSERAVVDKGDGKKIIRLLRNGQLVESPAKTGLRGDGGMIEIVSGAAAGDEAVVFIKAKVKK
jgi:RND family efflux transporter MFP subunit